MTNKNHKKRNRNRIKVTKETNPENFKPLTQEEDVLDDFRERIPIGQKYGCYSFVSDPNNEHTLKGFLCSGSFSTREDAQKHADTEMKKDNRYNIFVGENGLWCPFDPDPNSCQNAIYQERRLNNMMQDYLKQNEKQKDAFEIRKHELMKKAIYEGTEEGQLKLNEKDESLEAVEYRHKGAEARLIEASFQLEKLPDEIKELKSNIEIMKKKMEYLKNLRTR